ncbi:hypothetical protein GKJPGBOP_01971 [Streptomyces paromomycinus]|uniref:Tetracycline repressor TetR C-terminal domain-containing protein n=2 Tax=Streptomyces paromomycinus TaxID=92743 RepID=A0A401VZ39_STREY|nr:hypothetical protein GKJPGBOP_01971 [Streptomyces paromomycinus]
MDAAVLLVGHVRSITQQARAAGSANNPEAQLGAILTDLMQTHGEQFPVLTAALASSTQPGEQDEAWEFGLHRILDGLATHIDQHTR